MCQAEGHQPIPPSRELPAELLDVRKAPGAKLARHLSDKHDWRWDSFRPIVDVATDEPEGSLLSLLRRAHDSEHQHDDGFLWHDHSCKGVA